MFPALLWGLRLFNPEVIDRKKLRAAIHLIRTSPKTSQGRALFEPGFTLQEHSIFQVTEANVHLKTLLGEDGMTTREFNPEEKRWIINEQTICTVSFLYWATRYAFIIDWQGKLTRFVPNTAQNIVLEVLSEHEGKGLALLFQILKARQAGITTLVELILLWRTVFHPWSNSLVASSRPEKSKSMAGKMLLCMKNQPYWLVPAATGSVDSGKLSFGAQESFIHIRHGAMLSDMGRGDTLSAFHLSEVIEFQNPDEAIDSSLLRASHDNPMLIGFLESTANGRSGWWYEKWKFCKEFWPQGMSRLCPIFIPWYVIRDLYPTPSWLRAHPVPEDWKPPDIVVAHARRATDYIQGGSNPVATKELGAKWEMPLAQQWYWFVERQSYAQAKKLYQWYSEMPADDEEAFQNANPSIFDAELVYEISENRKPPVGVYGILAPTSEIPRNLQPNERDIDRALPPIEVVANWVPGRAAHRYTLVPLLHRGGTFSPNGKLLLYERPKLGETYGIGVDCGFGLDKDATAMEVIRKGSMSRPAAQVAEWVSPAVNSFALWPFAHAIGTLFSVPRGGRLVQPKMVIEGQGNGENVYNELKKRGWREWHNWVRLDRKRSPESKANRQLWYTTTWSRPLLMDMFMDAINKGWLEVHSPWFIGEMSDLEMDYTKMKIAAAGGKHDDRIMAMGMVLFSLHSRETKYLDQWTMRAQADEPPPFSYPSYSPGTQGNDHSERVGDATVSYTYRVIRHSDPDRGRLEGPGAGLVS